MLKLTRLLNCHFLQEEKKSKAKSAFKNDLDEELSPTSSVDSSDTEPDVAKAESETTCSANSNKCTTQKTNEIKSDQTTESRNETVEKSKETITDKTNEIIEENVKKCNTEDNFEKEKSAKQDVENENLSITDVAVQHSRIEKPFATSTAEIKDTKDTNKPKELVKELNNSKNQEQHATEQIRNDQQETINVPLSDPAIKDEEANQKVEQSPCAEKSEEKCIYARYGIREVVIRLTDVKYQQKNSTDVQKTKQKISIPTRKKPEAKNKNKKIKIKGVNQKTVQKNKSTGFKTKNKLHREDDTESRRTTRSQAKSESFTEPVTLKSSSNNSVKLSNEKLSNITHSKKIRKGPRKNTKKQRV